MSNSPEPGQMPPVDLYQPGADPDDRGRGPMVVGIIWTLTILAGAVIVMRLYARKITKSLSWDDWFMMAAFCFQIVGNGFMMKAYSYGLGKHDRNMTFRQVVNAVKWGWFWMFAGIFVATLARVSCSVFLVRLFDNRSWFKWYLIAFTTLQCASAVVLLFVTYLGVQPVEALWNPFVAAKATISADVSINMAYTTQALFTWADFTYVFFPVFFIWKLRMKLSRRIGLIALLMLSLLTVAASIAKATRVQNVSSELDEPLYSASLATLFSGVEQTVVMLLGSLPSTGAAIKMQLDIISRLRSQISSRSGRRSSQESNGSGGSGSKRWGMNCHIYAGFEDQHETGLREAENGASPMASARYFGKRGSQQHLSHQHLVHTEEVYPGSHELARTDHI